MQSIAYLSQAPKYILELFFVTIFVLVLIYINSYIQIESSVLISSISVIIISVLRLIPQMQLIYKNYSDLKFYAPTLYNISAENFSMKNNNKKVFEEKNINTNKRLFKFDKSIEFHKLIFHMIIKKFMKI